MDSVLNLDTFLKVLNTVVCSSEIIWTYIEKKFNFKYRFIISTSEIVFR